MDNSATRKTSLPEAIYQWSAHKLYLLSAFIIAAMVVPICLDVIARRFFGLGFPGVTEIETMSMVLITALAIPYITVQKTHIQVDLFFNRLSKKKQDRLDFFINFSAVIALCVLGVQVCITAMQNNEPTPLLRLPEWIFIFVSGLGLLLAAVGFGFHGYHSMNVLFRKRDYQGPLYGLAVVFLLVVTPFLYKGFGLRLSGITIGLIGFAVLMIVLFLRVPIPVAMIIVSLVGILIVRRRMLPALSMMGPLSYKEISNFLFVAVPMFLYMGELTVHTGIGRDLFECLNRWIGRVPGGLAVASIGGCAGFGAVCGDSMATAVTMSSVALPHMRAKKYDHALATGALAAGGSLGSLIPPSICFVIYSIMTEESVGRLFIAGIFPGLLLACIFIGIIIFRVKRNPALAPASDIYTLHEKIISLVYLLPIAGLFILVIGGIMGGFFTPGEGGAVGAAGVVLYGIVRRRLSWDGFKRATLSTTLICGKILFLIASVGVIKVFLTATRLPIELANSIVTMDVNRFIVLAMIILLYVFLGSVANIIPMMMITLPSIFPTVQALGFDGIWFGVLIVIVMEMGVVTPPIGINVFALSAAVPDIEMITIFKGVWPFFLGMVLCVIIVASFPQIALFLPNLLF